MHFFRPNPRGLPSRAGRRPTPPEDDGFFSGTNFRALVRGGAWGALVSIVAFFLFVQFFLPWFTKGYDLLAGGWVTHP